MCPGGLWILMLGLVRKSAVSGNSTGDQLLKAPLETDPWLGDPTGLRPGEAPSKTNITWGSDDNKVLYCLQRLDLNREGHADVILVLGLHEKTHEAPCCYCTNCMILPARLGAMW